MYLNALVPVTKGRPRLLEYGPVPAMRTKLSSTTSTSRLIILDRTCTKRNTVDCIDINLDDGVIANPGLFLYIINLKTV